MARAATNDELTKLRSNGQASRLYLAIHRPATVLACRINQTFETADQVNRIAYDGVTAGAYTDVIEGMTLYVGSSAGAWDLGLARVLSATDEELVLNTTSDIPWADNLYLTVVDEIGLWPRNIVQIVNDLLMDGNTGYSDQHANYDAVPVLGPLAAVLWLDGESVSHTPTASDSWVLGANITGYSWAAPGAASIDDDDTDTPTITYNVARGANAYRTDTIVLSDNSKTGVGHRRVFVFDRGNNQPIKQFVVRSLEGQYGAGWRMNVELFDQVAIADVRDRALVVLFAEDWYGGVKGSIGPVSGYENVLFAGWIDGETIQIDPVKSTAQFVVDGPAGWLDRIQTDSLALINTSISATKWTEIQNLTVDKAYYHLMRWRSTATLCMDCYRTGDTHQMPVESQLSGGLFGQLTAIGSRVFAVPSSDALGRLFFEVDAQMLPTSSRGSIPTVMALTKNDWSDMQIERRPGPAVSMVDMAGTMIGQTILRSRAPGLIPARSGIIQRYDEILVSTQDEIDVLSGLAYARDNNQYPNVDIDLVQNNRLIGTCPMQRVSISLAAGDTPRGITWTNKLFLPRRVALQVTETGIITTSLTLEAETSGPRGVLYIQPQNPIENVPDQPDPTDPPISPIDSPPGDPPDHTGRDPDDRTPTCYEEDAPANGAFEMFPQGNTAIWDPDLPDEEQDNSISIPYPCYIRAGSAQNPTQVRLQATIDYRVGDAWRPLSPYDLGKIQVAGVDSAGSDLIIGSNQVYAGYPNLMLSNFAPAGGINVAGFKARLTGPVITTSLTLDPESNWYTDEGMVKQDSSPDIVFSGHTDTNNGTLGYVVVDVGFIVPNDYPMSFNFRIKPYGIAYGQVCKAASLDDPWSCGVGFGSGGDWETRGTQANGYRYFLMNTYDGNHQFGYGYLTGYRYEATPRLTRMSLYRAWVANVCGVQ